MKKSKDKLSINSDRDRKRENERDIERRREGPKHVALVLLDKISVQCSIFE